MAATENFALPLPQMGEPADIRVLNRGTEEIDGIMQGNRTMIAPAFDGTKAYVVGDPVVYLGELFVFIADKSAGAWDASKVEPTTAAEMGGGGASALADLDDVEITSPAQGQALLFNDDDDLWKNQTLPDASVTKTATGNPIELTDAAAAPMVKCVTQITGYQSGTGTPSPDNIRPITAYTEGEIEVSDGDGNVTTHTTTYPNAIYRGSEDVVNGEVTEEWGMIASYAGETLPGEWISDRDEYAPGTTPTTGAQVAYELATPSTNSVTPTNLPIRTLSGYNHIESSTGEMEIEYITENYQPLVELIQSSDHIYSTQEQAVGTWVDGKTLYEQTIYLASASISSGTSASMPSISGVETVMVVGGSCYDVNDQRYYPLPYIRFNDTESIKIQAHVVSGSLVTLVFTNFSTAYSLKDISVVIRYTKASSNNRSLSKGGGEQEVKEEVKEEAKEEPTEEQKEETKEENENNETER